MSIELSIIIPIYNEEGNIPILYNRLKSVADGIGVSYELIFINDGSKDASLPLIISLANQDANVKYINFSRNFGHQIAVTAGIDHCSGNAIAIIDADLQDPPELIPTFLRTWEEGFENVYGVVTKREGTGPIRTMNSKMFYWLAGKLTDGRIPRNASDFRLVDRKVYVAVRGMTERNRFVRGLFAWAGFNSIGIPMERPPRFGGVSNAHTFKVLDLAFKGIFAHSYKPLRLITVFGFLVSAISFVSIVPLFFLWVFVGVPFAGFGTLVGLFLLVFGIVSLMLGILSEYVGLIYEEVKARPNYLVSEFLE
jgi:dolichol-phosphate mannosyltransferase